MPWLILLFWYVGTGLAFVLIFEVRCFDENNNPCVWYKNVLALCIAVFIWPYMFYKAWSSNRVD